jgi:hypothetical protein
MSRAMVILIDHHAVSIEMQNSRHVASLT